MVAGTGQATWQTLQSGTAHSTRHTAAPGPPIHPVQWAPRTTQSSSPNKRVPCLCGERGLAGFDLTPRRECIIGTCIAPASAPMYAHCSGPRHDIAVPEDPAAWDAGVSCGLEVKGPIRTPITRTRGSQNRGGNGARWPTRSRANCGGVRKDQH